MREESRKDILTRERIMIDIKNVYIDDSERRELFAAEDYVRTIGEEILCQVGKFYKSNNRYPNESEIKSFSSKAANNDLKNGIYDIKLEVGAEPNDKDFTVLFDRNCTNKTAEDGNVVVLSPLYGDSGRYCVYNKIDEIIVGIALAMNPNAAPTITQRIKPKMYLL